MNCPTCGTKDAYQGFNYRDKQVDCVNARCVQYNAKHAKAVAATQPEAVDPDDTKPGRKTEEKYTGLQSGAAITLVNQYQDQGLLDDEALNKLWDQLFGKTSSVSTHQPGSVELRPGETIVLYAQPGPAAVRFPPGHTLWYDGTFRARRYLSAAERRLAPGNSVGYHNTSPVSVRIWWQP